MTAAISIIIPTANEASALPECLTWIAPQPNETIVVDAASDDGTPEIATSAGCLLVSHPQRNRARQMNLGARRANGQILLFLHADTLLPAGALTKIDDAVIRKGYVGGAFSRRYRSRSLTLALTARLAALRSHLFGWHLGDQAIFVRRDVFEALGGYHDMAIFEDLDFSRRLRSFGPTVTLTPAVRTSARRFAEKGPVRTTWDDLLLTRQYLSGKDPNDLCLPAQDRIEPLQSYERLP